MTRQRTLVTEERIDDFCKRLKERGRDVARIRAVCLGERNFLKNAHYVKRGDDAEEVSTLALSTRHGLITRYRNEIRARFGDNHPALRYMVLSDEEQAQRNAAGRKTIVARHTDRRAIHSETHVSTIIARLNEAQEIHPLTLAAALIAATGRRSVEILLTGDFNLVKEPDEALFAHDLRRSQRHSILFSGQAKTKGSENAHSAPYEIPVLAPALLVMQAFTILRRRYPLQHLTPKQVSDRCAGGARGLIACSKKEFQDFEEPNEGLSPSELRAAYATIAYEWYAPAEHSWNAYTARILGHSIDDLVTSFSYDQFYPTGAKRGYGRSVEKATRETLERLLKQRERELNPQAREYINSKIAAVKKRLAK